MVGVQLGVLVVGKRLFWLDIELLREGVFLQLGLIGKLLLDLLVAAARIA